VRQTITLRAPKKHGDRSVNDKSQMAFVSVQTRPRTAQSGGINHVR
jgi:hypothetical protein